MASCANHSLLFPSPPSSSILFPSPPSSSILVPSKVSIQSSMFDSRRQPPVVLKQKTSDFLGFSDLKLRFGCSIQRNSWFGTIPRRCNKGWGSEGEGDFSLETEILKFMDASENPNKFPTKNELMNAGRGDLVQAIEKDGEFLSKYWDLKVVEYNDERILRKEVAIRVLIQFLSCISEQKEKECVNGGELKQLEEDFSLETEILKFMDASENPNKFPTKNELMNAGRGDLVQAIEKNSNSLSKDWDLNVEEYSDEQIFEKKRKEVAIRALIQFVSCFSEQKEKGLVSGRLKQFEERRQSFGIRGILKRFLKEGNLSSRFGSREEETDNELKVGSLMAAVVTGATWDEYVLKSDVPVLVEFWAAWCGPCTMVHREIEEIAKEYVGRINCYTLKVDDDLELAETYNIKGVPVVMMFKNGKKQDSVIGTMPKYIYVKAIEKLLTS